MPPLLYTVHPPTMPPTLLYERFVIFATSTALLATATATGADSFQLPAAASTLEKVDGCHGNHLIFENFSEKLKSEMHVSTNKTSSACAHKQQ